MTREELFNLAFSRERKTWRGKNIKKMDKPWTSREEVFTCSNGWTIELIHIDDFWLEGLFMGHCLGLERGPKTGRAYSLRDLTGTPHVTIYGNEASGRCNQRPPEKYLDLIREWKPDIYSTDKWGVDEDEKYHKRGILEDTDYRDLEHGVRYRTETWREKRELVR